MCCVSSASFSVLINGKLIGFFQSNRGLRQGDPLSPFLFTLVMEVLARRLNNLRLDKKFGFHLKCKKITLTHLMFADDVLIMAKANMNSILAIRKALDDFYLWSGLEVSYAKSNIYCGGVSRSVAVLLAEGSGFALGELPFKYLGIPLDSHCLR
ncbi:hypothetical protein QQ045_025755 [Rhodiola kirilowii]